MVAWEVVCGDGGTERACWVEGGAGEGAADELGDEES